MVMLCFVLDLRSLSPSLLRDLKQSVLQLANYYATYVPIGQRHKVKPDPLLDRIGLCYVQRNRSSLEDELKVAYYPQGNFSLRDFHHAVNNIPADDDELPLGNNVDLKLQSLLNNQLLYSWGGEKRDDKKKVLLISSRVVEKLDSPARQALLDAADKCVSVEFICFKQDTSGLLDLPKSIDNFLKQIRDLKNCSFRNYLPGECISLVKSWFSELTEDVEEPYSASFIFKLKLVDNLEKISCNLSPAFNHLTDIVAPSLKCSCHGLVIEHYLDELLGYCPRSQKQLGQADVVKNSNRDGLVKPLFRPSLRSMSKVQVMNPLTFTIVERTSLAPLFTNGHVVGCSYVVTPKKRLAEMEAFQCLRSTLNSFDEGLVCFAYCDIEAETETTFKCFYLLSASKNGMMLLRRLAAAEDILPMYVDAIKEAPLPATDVQATLSSNLLKIKMRDYDPIEHEGGFHEQVNLLMMENLQLREKSPDRIIGFEYEIDICGTCGEEFSDFIDKKEDAIKTLECGQSVHLKCYKLSTHYCRECASTII